MAAVIWRSLPRANLEIATFARHSSRTKPLLFTLASNLYSFPDLLMRILPVSDHPPESSSRKGERAPDSVRHLEGLARLPAVDAGRVLATFAIVWVHNLAGMNDPDRVGALCRFGTSFYILVAALFVVRTSLRDPQRSFARDLEIRGRRLLRPYLVWCGVYFCYYGFFALKKGVSWEVLARWWGPFAGTAIHLWFLPFVFFWGVLASRAVPRLQKLPLPVLLLGTFTLGYVSYRFCYGWLFYAVSRPWLWEYHLHRLDRWIVEIPLFVTATLTFTTYLKLSPRIRNAVIHRAPFLAVGCVMAFLATEWIYTSSYGVIEKIVGGPGRFMAHIAGFFLLCAFLCLGNTRIVARLAPWGRYTYLLFLMHMLLIDVFRIFDQSLPWFGTVPFSFFSTCMLFALGLGLARLIQRTGWLRLLRA